MHLADANLLQDIRKLIAKEHGHDCGRGLIGAQPVIVGRRRGRGPEQPPVLVQTANGRHQKNEKHGVLVRRVARIEQAPHFGVADGVIEVLAGSVDAEERFFM